MNDIFGIASLSYFEGNKNAAIHVNTNLTEDEEIPVSYLFRSFDEMPEFEQYALLHSSGNILDIGAGVGPHSLYLQENSFSVTALEPSELCCEIMKKRGVKEIVKNTLRSFTTKNQFDTILLLMNGIGLAGKIENLDSFLCHLKDLLAPNGKIFCTSTDIIYLFEDEDGTVEIDLNDGYYGEMQYDISFDSKHDSYDWLYLSADVLFMHAEKIGLKGELVAQNENGSYLALLSH